jgi:alanine racemase
MNYSIDEFTAAIGAKRFGNSHCFVSHVSIDSRSVTSGVGLAFFALVGDRFNGHRFIGELYANSGVRVFVVSDKNAIDEKFTDATFLLVDSSQKSLQQLAAYHRSKFTYPVIGITGSNGKTIVKEWLAQLLSYDRRVVRSPKSFNSQVGVPLSVLQMDDHFDMGIFEAGISQSGEMEHLQPMVKPQIGIFTNLGSAHQENFGSLQEKCTEKIKLFSQVETLIYCSDHEIIDTLAHDLKSKAGVKLFTWGSNDKADIKIQGKEIRGLSTTLSLRINNELQGLTIPFSDSASIENAMHTITLMVLLGIPLETIAQRVHQLQPVAMRLELKEGRNGCTIINDSYNSDLGSLTVALDFMGQMAQHNRRILILSDILQSGRKPEELYAEVANLVKSKGISQIVGVGEEISRHSHLFNIDKKFFPTTQALLGSFPFNEFYGSSVLIKGSRPFEFERVSALLEQKTHRTYLEINLNALVHNLNYFKGLLKPNVRVMAMVKAFSYGSGSFEIANLLQFHRVDYLGVAFADEGVALREAGIRVPIVVLNPAFGSYETMITHNLEPEIFSFDSLSSFAAEAQKLGVISYPIHIKIDTGMHRLGFNAEDISTLFLLLHNMPQLRVSTILSHMVAADELGQDSFSLSQIEQFAKLSTQLSEGLGYKPIRHILNSAGIERFPHAQFDMVRLGIGLYGISAVHGEKIQTVSSLVTFIAQLRNVASGETVGYNRKGKVERNSVIATIPIGYADGLNRRLSNGVGKVLVNGKLVPIIGNVCMDSCMIDVTDVVAKEGDEVVVFGQKPTITDLANWLGTIPYEILTSISRRVKRVYFQE